MVDLKKCFRYPYSFFFSFQISSSSSILFNYVPAIGFGLLICKREGLSIDIVTLNLLNMIILTLRIYKNSFKLIHCWSVVRVRLRESRGDLSSV